MLHGPQRGLFELSFALPSECADRVEAGQADIGIVPCAELTRLSLDIIPGVGIACQGAVRSILLISQRPWDQVRKLAADAGSRTSVLLARIILGEQFGSEPEVVSQPANLPAMLSTADAALIIGDPALRVKPAELPYQVMDLGEAWWALTGLPMVFALWAGRPEVAQQELADAFGQSACFGKRHVTEIAQWAERERGIPQALAREYLTRHIVFDIGEREMRGLDRFLKFAREYQLLGARA